jgi:hypothetical protein
MKESKEIKRSAFGLQKVILFFLFVRFCFDFQAIKNRG